MSLALVLPSIPFSAWAQDEAALSPEQNEEFKRLTTEAAQKFEAGDFEPAAKLFLEAYEIKPVSNILYNVGRIYEKAGNLPLALENFEKFVKSPNVEQEPRRDAVERIKTIREVLALEDDGQKDQQTAQPAPEKPAEKEQDHTLAWVLMGTGGAALLGSGVMAFLASSANSDFEDANSVQARRDAADSGETYSLVADTLLITGVVLAGAGVAVYFLVPGSETDSNATTLRIAPTVSAHGAGLGLDMNF